MATLDEILTPMPQVPHGNAAALRKQFGLPTGGGQSENATPGGISTTPGAVSPPQTAQSAPAGQTVRNQQPTTLAETVAAKKAADTPLPQVNAPDLTAPATVQNPYGINGQKEKKEYTYEEMFRMLNPFRPMSEAELEAQRKRQRANTKITALGDALSALSNIVATAHGATNAYDGKNTMTGAQLARYDQLRKDYDDNLKAYMSGLMSAKQMDKQEARAARAELESKLREAKEDARYKNSQIRQAGLDAYNQAYQQQQLDLRRAENAQQQENWNRNFEENQRRNDAATAQAWQRIKDNRELTTQKIGAAAAKAARGKEIVFNDTKGNEMSIYENVWKGSMQQVYDALIEEMKAAGQTPRTATHKTAQAKDDFVKQNWDKYPATVRMMNILAGLDPAAGIGDTSEDTSLGLGWGSDDTGMDW